MKRFLAMGSLLFVAACSGAPPSALDDPYQPEQPTSADDAAPQPDVTELPDFHDAAPEADAADAADEPGDDAAPDAGLCSDYAGPDTSAACHACTGAGCQQNGCFNGYYCNVVTTHCVPPPDGC
jgi:hypothetical protein